ncbi:MAG: hypothetical protein C0458_05375 [Methylobacterium sp.]|nr:hypothetical protein [Methylobacterium sp.]
MADLEELIERVESGTGYDNELNKDIALALGWSIETGLPQGLRWRRPDGSLTASNPEYEEPFNVTGSLDAVLALIEAKRSELPDISAADFLAGCIDEMMQRGWRPDEPNGPQICRAALAGLLRALETQHDR